MSLVRSAAAARGVCADVGSLKFSCPSCKSSAIVWHHLLKPLLNFHARAFTIIPLFSQVLRAGSRAFSAGSLKAEERFPPYLLNAPATEVTTLQNGVRVATEVSLFDDVGTAGVVVADSAV